VKPQWEPTLRAQLDKDRYDCVFADFQTTDLTQYDLVVPLTLKDYAGLASQPEAARRRALVPPFDVVSLCHDKLRFNRFLLATPHAWTIPRLLEDESPDPPFVLKRREDEFGAHTYLVRNDEDRARCQHLMRRQAFFAQRYIPGDREYASHILIRRGVPIFHLNVVYEMGDDFYVKNNTFKQKKIVLNRDEKELPLFTRILAEIGYDDGTCCFNYKYDNGRMQLFELNPRFGGSLNRGINDYLHAYEAALST
jgi:glutathione synthase/RimK-type ligase-like ATP-grasp enzyme